MTFDYRYELHAHINDEHVVNTVNPAELPPLLEAEAIVPDPLDITPDHIPSPVIFDNDEKLADVYREKWSDIRTKIKKGQIQDLYRIRLTSSHPDDLFKNLELDIFSGVYSIIWTYTWISSH